MNTCSRECKTRKTKRQDNVSIHQHLYRWTGQAKCPADSCWTGLVEGKLRLTTKQPLCLLLLGAGREKGVEDAHMQPG